MTDHGAREHATWAASSTARNVYCPGALALSANAPAQRESEHAARGTACHQIAEKALRTGADVSAFLGETERTKERPVVIDEELVESARVYVEYVDWKNRDGGQLWIEQKFSLAPLSPPFDAGGTGDAVLHFPAEKELEIVDLKNGMGVVDVEGNPQLRTYALGALLANPGLDVERVTVTIVQPRAPHKDGRIRSETFHVAELLDWTTDLLAAMRRSKQALDEYATVTGDLTRDAWADKWLNPGKCKFCPAEGFCPKLRNRALEVAAVWFDDGGKATIGNTPADASPEKVAADLDAIPMLEDWIKARRAFAHTLAEQGTPIPNYQLVDKHGLRKWGADEEKVKADLVLIAGLAPDEIYAEPKLKSPAQIEKTLGAKRKDLIRSMWMVPVTGQNLVRIDKTSRPPAKDTAARHFQAEN